MLSTSTYHGRIAGLVVVLAVVVSAGRAVAVSPPNLLTPGNTFTSNSHYVSTTIFPWFKDGTTTQNGVWQPLEGLPNWTGETPHWEGQIKQMMAANIDVMKVWSFPIWAGWDKQRVNMFQALSNLRSQGYNVPKVAPFLDTVATWGAGWTPGQAQQTVDLNTSAGKDAFVDQYSYFYTQYFAVNSDFQADSYIAQIDGRVLLDSYALGVWAGLTLTTNSSSLTREDVRSRLVNTLGSESVLFRDLPTNGIFMVNDLGNAFTFTDEEVSQFQEIVNYRDNNGARGRWTVMVKPGFWSNADANFGWRFTPRNGGSAYQGAWNAALALSNQQDVKHVAIESWNEYGEGSGIYAANPAPTIVPGNPHNDTWSSTNDPYEYIKTTAESARQFNDTPDLDATILWNNFPTTMLPGETLTARVIVRNDGDLSWTGAAEFKFGEKEFLDPVLFGALDGRTLIDDAANEIPTYGGIFRGRPITFNVQLTAPTTPGVYSTHWGMVQEGVAWFGDELSLAITVALAGDFDNDGVVDGNDFLLWQLDPSVGSLADWEANYGMVAPLSAASAALPEPSVLAILTTGILAFFSWSRVTRRVAK